MEYVVVWNGAKDGPLGGQLVVPPEIRQEPLRKLADLSVKDERLWRWGTLRPTIIRALQEKPEGWLLRDLADYVHASPSRVSNHLYLLKRDGLIRTRPDRTQRHRSGRPLSRYYWSGGRS